MVGDPGIEPGVRLREGVTVPLSGASVPKQGSQCLHSQRNISSDSLCPEKSSVNLKKLERPLTLLSPLREEHGANAVAAVYSRHPQHTTKDIRGIPSSPQVRGCGLALVDLQPPRLPLWTKRLMIPRL
tara:strand:- start:374 stop:757 length:384 start_codon:yes stop_codon:yes gene_type:complete